MNKKGQVFPQAIWNQPADQRGQAYRDLFTSATMGATTAPMGATPIMAKASQLVSHEGAPDLQQVTKYLNKILKGEPIEPIKIIREGAKYGIEDGKQRFAAYQALGIKDIPVELVGVANRGKTFIQDKVTGLMKGSKSIVK